MGKIEITPYSEIEDQSFSSDTVVSVKNKFFKGVPVDESKTTFTFVGCRFRKVTIKNTEEIEFESVRIQFVACVIEDFQIEEILSKNISISFFSSILSGRLESNQLNSLSINNCICKSLFLINLENVNISYTEGNVFPKYWKKVLNSVSSDFLTLISETQSFHVSDVKNLVFKTTEVSDVKRGLNRRGYQKFDIYRIGYYLTAEQKELFRINLSIKLTQDVQNQSTKISDSYLNSLSLSGRSEGTISIDSTKINSWYISGFFSTGEASFYNIQPLSENEENIIGIHKSNLDGVWFDNVDFDRYKRISIYRTKLAMTIFTSCNFPDKYSSFERFTPIENVHYPERKSKNHHKDQYEIFLQLKKALEATGNYFESQKLQAIAHDALSKINSISTWDKFILNTNSFSNNHGLSIKRPLGWFFLLSIFFYLAYLFSLGKLFNSAPIDYNLIGYYFSFIDLTHRPNFLVEKGEFNVFSLTFDYVGKVVVGFFIYQFIAAFRKYGKN